MIDFMNKISDAGIDSRLADIFANIGKLLKDVLSLDRKTKERQELNDGEARGQEQEDRTEEE